MAQTRTGPFKLTAWANRSSYLGGITICIVFLWFALAWGFSSGSVTKRIVGWVGIAFLGLAVIAYVRLLLRWRPLLEADEKGIALPQMGAEIDWADVERLRLSTQFFMWPIRKNWLGIVPADQSRIRWAGVGWKLLGRMNRWYGGSMVVALESFSSPPANKVLQELQDKAPVPLVDEREGWTSRRRRRASRAT